MRKRPELLVPTETVVWSCGKDNGGIIQNSRCELFHGLTHFWTIQVFGRICRRKFFWDKAKILICHSCRPTYGHKTPQTAVSRRDYWKKNCGKHESNTDKLTHTYRHFSIRHFQAKRSFKMANVSYGWG